MTSPKLAIDGGAPVREQLLPYGRQTVTDADVSAVAAVLRSDFLTTGPAVEQFERLLAETTGARAVAAVSSGTAALHAMYASCGIGPGDEVIVPAITFAATANAAVYVGARPVFADVEADTLLIDAESVERVLTTRTRAIVGVDFAGQPAGYDALREVAAARDIRVLADAAHSLGATAGGRKAGQLADASSFSFHPVKHVAAGEGGAVGSTDPDLVDRCRIFRNHGINADHAKRAARGTWYYEMQALGYNYRLSDIHAALGASQLRRLDENIARRREITASYDSAFGEMESIAPLTTRTGNGHVHHIYVVLLNLERLRVGRGEMFAALRAENIGVNVHYIPVPWHPYYRELGYEPGKWPVTEGAYERMITLPIWPGMTDEDIKDVVEAVHKVIDAYGR